jgi:hypothetical protein
LADELQLKWTQDDEPSNGSYSKRALIGAYTSGWSIHQLIVLARRVVGELDVNSSGLQQLLAEYDKGGGVSSPPKNLIFAANGPKPELVLRDAVSNDIEIVRNGEYCLVFDRPIPADGLSFLRLIDWWREREGLQDADDRELASRSIRVSLQACKAIGPNCCSLIHIVNATGSMDSRLPR